MSKAWNHKVRLLTEQEIKKQTEDAIRWYKWLLENYPNRDSSQESCINSERKCRISGKCHEPSTHLLTYHYVTGRQGRVSFAEKQVCEKHAQKYTELIPLTN